MEVAHGVANITPSLEGIGETQQFGAPACDLSSQSLSVRSHPAVVAWVLRSVPEGIELVDIPDSVDLSECLIVRCDEGEAVVRRGCIWPEPKSD